MTATRIDNTARHREVADLYNRHDAALMAAARREDAWLVDHATGQVVRGQEEFQRYVQTTFDGSSDDRIVEFEVVGARDWTVARFVTRGTHDGSWGGMEPTLRTLEQHGCAVVRWQHGLVAEEHVYYDLYGMLAQLGQVPPLTATA